jgi:hypothetical protein
VSMCRGATARYGQLRLWLSGPGSLIGEIIVRGLEKRRARILAGLDAVISSPVEHLTP